MSRQRENHRLFCWEQVQRVNPLFRISQPFAPRDRTDGLLALYALFAAVEELCAECSDAELARRKLDWWRSECLAADPADSAHPILCELTRAGVALDRESLSRLFDHADARLDGDPPADESALQTLCRDAAGPQCRLELDYTAGGANRPDCRAPAQRIGLAQLLRESARRERSNRFWWLPLNLLARHGIGRAELGSDPDAEPARAVFADVLRTQRSWNRPATAWPAGARHLAVQERLQGLALARLERCPPSAYARRLRKVDAGMLLRAWAAARRVSRP